MDFYRDVVYPLLVSRLGDPAPIRRIRAGLLAAAEGRVLEIGVGSGANFVHYDAARVTTLYALEPNPGMVRLAQAQRAGLALNVRFLRSPAEHIPIEDGSIDTAVTTFTLCTIPGVAQAIQELRRVLRPGGKLLFFELGASPDPAVGRWQTRLEPLHRRLFQGLHLTRDIPALLRAGSFRIERMQQGYLARFPRFLTYSWWGVGFSIDD